MNPLTVTWSPHMYTDVGKTNFENCTSILIDGIRIESDTGWGLLRASNTTPVLVLRFEADTNENLELIKNDFKKILSDINPSLGDF